MSKKSNTIKKAELTIVFQKVATSNKKGNGLYISFAYKTPNKNADRTYRQRLHNPRNEVHVSTSTFKVCPLTELSKKELRLEKASQIRQVLNNFSRSMPDLKVVDLHVTGKNLRDHLRKTNIGDDYSFQLKIKKNNGASDMLYRAIQICVNDNSKPAEKKQYKPSYSYRPC